MVIKRSLENLWKASGKRLVRAAEVADEFGLGSGLRLTVGRLLDPGAAGRL
jgi:hypothetical protein